MSKIEKYLGIANHDIQVANNSDELKSYVASILCEIDELQQENQQLKNDINKLQKELNEENLQCSKYSIEFNDLKEKNKQIKETYKEVFNNYQKLKKDNETLTLLNIHQSDKIQQLKDNWNKLKEWLEKELGDRINPNKDKWLTGVYDAYRETIDKMHKLEQGSDSND